MTTTVHIPPDLEEMTRLWNEYRAAIERVEELGQELASRLASGKGAPLRKRNGRGQPKAGRASEETVLAYVKSNPGLRSEQIGKGIGADPKWALARLRAAKLVSMKGQRRAATYSAGKGKKG